MATTTNRRLAGTALLAVLAGLMTACSSSGASSTTTTGGGATAEPASADAWVLSIGTDDNATMPGAEQIQHFAQEVARRSGGTITVEPSWHAAGDTAHWDQAVGRLLLDGDLDLAMVPSRAWDDLGVSSLTALTAPFLITTDTLTERVLADDDLVSRLTSGLPDVGAEALGLYPEGLRHPFGFHGPLLGAEDYRGGVMRTAWSRGVDAMFEALGATTDDKEATSEMIGAESSFRLTPGGVATGNVVFYPKVNVLAARSDLRDELTDEQWALLQEASEATAEWVRDTLPTEAEAAATYCSEAGDMAMASRRARDSLVRATRGVVTELRQDPTTADAIDRITELAGSTPLGDPVQPCPATAGDEAALDGTYAFTVTPEAAREAGARDEDRIQENTGDFTVALADGRWSMTQIYAIGPKAGTEWTGTGDYAFSDGQITFYWSHEPGEWTSARVEVDAQGLTMSEWEDGAPTNDNLALDSVFLRRWVRTAG